MIGSNEPRLNQIEKYLHQEASRIISSISIERLKNDVIKFLGPHDRIHNPDAMLKVEKLLFEEFKAIGWKAERRPFQFVFPEQSGVNILAVKTGGKPIKALIIEAHYDTVRSTFGADDNIASIAALLELARLLKSYKLSHTVILAACDMEELGFYGAKALVQELKDEYHIEGTLVFETMAYSSKAPNSQSVPLKFELIYPQQAKKLKMRGWTGDDTIVVYRNLGKSLAVCFSESLVHVAGENAVTMLREPGDLPFIGKTLRKFPIVSHFFLADHVPFWEANIPAIQITDSAYLRNPNYHKITDKPETLDYELLAKIVAASAITILRLAGVEKGVL